MAVLGLPIGTVRGDLHDGFLQVTTDAADVAKATDRYDFIVRDNAASGIEWTDCTNYLVSRPCYLSLRRAVSEVAVPYAGIIAMMEPSRALSTKDMEMALGHEVVAEVQTNPVAARTIDAGLFAGRWRTHFPEVHTLALSHRAEVRI